MPLSNLQTCPVLVIRIRTNKNARNFRFGRSGKAGRSYGILWGGLPEPSEHVGGSFTAPIV
jgi:hypothetical protein